AGDSITSYVWTEGGPPIATGVSPTVNLTPGSHTIYLTVEDTHGAPSTNVAFVIITVNPEPNQNPVANAGLDQTVVVSGALTAVTLNGTGSSDPDGDTLTYAWSEGATPL